MAKFPYLSLEANEADMGAVIVGCSSHCELRFGNHSEVPANFSIYSGERASGAFMVTPTQ